MLAEIAPDAKIICCVRSVIEILDSLERLFRHSPLQVSRIYDFETRCNIYTRVEQLMAAGGLVGWAYASLKEAFYGQFANRVMLVQYKSLSSRPRETMAAIYDFLDEDSLEHDFHNIE